MKPKPLIAVGLGLSLGATWLAGPSGRPAESAPVVATAEALPASSTIESQSFLNTLPIEQTTTSVPTPIEPVIYNMTVAEPTEPPEHVMHRPVTPRKFLIVGDSITQGLEGQGLIDRLANRGVASVIIQAACGRPLMGDKTYTSCDSGHPKELTGLKQIMEPKLRTVIAKSTDMVVEQGTNDFYRTKAEFMAEAQQAVKYIRSISPTVRISWLNTYVPGRGESYKNINEAIAGSGAKVIDITGIASPYYGPPACPGSDGVHPCPEGYIKITDKIISSLIPKIPQAAK